MWQWITQSNLATKLVSVSRHFACREDTMAKDSDVREKKAREYCSLVSIRKSSSVILLVVENE